MKPHRHIDLLLILMLAIEVATIFAIAIYFTYVYYDILDRLLKNIAGKSSQALYVAMTRKVQ